VAAKKLKQSFFNRKLIVLTAISNVLKDQSANFKAEQSSQLKQKAAKKNGPKNKQEYKGNMFEFLKRKSSGWGWFPKKFRQARADKLPEKCPYLLCFCPLPFSPSTFLPFLAEKTMSSGTTKCAAKHINSKMHKSKT